MTDDDLKRQTSLEMKKDFILVEYRRQFDNVDRIHAGITTGRQWEITLLAAIFGLAATQSFPSTTFSLMLAVFLIFTVMEVMAKGHATLQWQQQVELHQLLSTSGDVDDIFSRYTLPSHKWQKYTSAQKAKAALSGAVTSADFLVWNCCLIFFFVAMYSVTF